MKLFEVRNYTKETKYFKNVNLAILLCPFCKWDQVGIYEYESNIEIFNKVGILSVEKEKKISIPEWVHSDIDKKIRVYFGILCIEEVLGIFENNYLENFIPREALEVSKKWIEKECAFEIKFLQALKTKNIDLSMEINKEGFVQASCVPCGCYYLLKYLVGDFTSTSIVKMTESVHRASLGNVQFDVLADKAVEYFKRKL